MITIHKTIQNISAVVLFTMVLVGAVTPASSAVIDHDDDAKVITVHPTPKLELSILGAAEAGREGAVMLVSLEYDAKQVTEEIESLRLANPGYQVNTARADSDVAQATLSLPDMKAEWPLAVRASQLGLYINTSVTLTPSQIRHLQKLGSRAAEAFVLKVPSSSSFVASRVVETYKADASLCGRIAGTNVRSVIRSLMEITKPREIRNSQTFDDLKKQIVDRCFALPNSTASVSTWSSLLDTAVERTRETQAITATYTQRTTVQMRHTIAPTIALTIN